MSKKRLLIEYKRNIKSIIKCAKNTGLTDEQIDGIVRESFSEFKAKSHQNVFKSSILKISIVVLLSLSVFMYVLLNVHTPTSSVVLRNVQGLTYPALKFIRILAVPIIKLFPSVTDLHDESCLIENPYFYLSDLDCSPCENVYNVIDLTGVEGINAYKKVFEGVPFIIKTNQPEVSFKDLQQLYKNYTAELASDSSRLQTRNLDVNSIKDVLSLDEHALSPNVHIQWRVNKMAAARIIRKVFSRPHFFLERTGQAVEHFLHVDGANAEPYSLPNPECSYVFIIQGSGERTIALKPPRECAKHCKAISVHMEPAYVLLYNWWYWRPVSLPGSVYPNLSISYMNSYC
uniref:Uncharacterized protein n=1 Tax=Dendroctonus ponderosae TaxID=77166 RepID=A0AAR5P7M4_DENPD